MEILMTRSDDSPVCTRCGGKKLEKRISTPSSFSGNTSSGFPGKGDTVAAVQPVTGGLCGSGKLLRKEVFMILKDILASLNHDAEIKDIRVGIFHTAVLTRNCGLAASFQRCP
jgi:hypothetical protein